jgi:hypothetical protein
VVQAASLLGLPAAGSPARHHQGTMLLVVVELQLQMVAS